MENNELKKLDQIPTSNRPWYFRTPFWGIILFLVVILVQFVLRYFGY